MTRSELIGTLAQCFPQLVQKEAEMPVSEILGAIADSLVAGKALNKAIKYQYESTPLALRVSIVNTGLRWH